MSIRRGPPVTWALIIINVLVFVACYGQFKGLPGQTLLGLSLNYFAATDLYSVGALAADGVRSGEYWRLLLATFLHGGIWHLLFNMLALRALGRFCELILGWAAFVLLYFLSGLAGGLGSIYLGPAAPYPGGPMPVSVGASGAIMGLVGAGMVLALRYRRWMPPGMGRFIFLQLALATGFILALGQVVAVTDNAGHLGGLVGGLALGGILPAERFRTTDARLRRSAMAQLAAGVLGLAVVVAAWGLIEMRQGMQELAEVPLEEFHDPRGGLSIDLPEGTAALEADATWPRVSPRLALAFDLREVAPEWLEKGGDRQSIEVPPGARDAYLLRRRVVAPDGTIVQEWAIYLIPPRALALVIEYPEARSASGTALAERVRRSVRWDR